MIHGFCLGGGLAIALCTDIRLADESAEFAIPAAKLGLGYNARWVRPLLAAVPPAKVKEMLFTGRRFKVAEAQAMGLVNTVVPAAELEATTRALAGEIAANAPLTVRAAKRTIDELMRNPQTPDLAALDAAVAACFAERGLRRRAARLQREAQAALPRVADQPTSSTTRPRTLPARISGASATTSASGRVTVIAASLPRSRSVARRSHARTRFSLGAMTLSMPASVTPRRMNGATDIGRSRPCARPHGGDAAAVLGHGDGVGQRVRAGNVDGARPALLAERPRAGDDSSSRAMISVAPRLVQIVRLLLHVRSRR